MSIETQTFSPDILNNYFAFSRFFSGEEQIKEILQEDPTSFKKSDELYFPPGRAVWILFKAPFEWILSLFLEAVGYILSCLGCERGKALLTVSAKQLVREKCQLDAQRLFREKLLVPCYNTHQLSSWDVYCTASLPTSFVTDPLVKEMTWPAEFARVGGLCPESVYTLKFAHLGGACRGCIAWFAHLFFKTKGHFINEKDHLTAVAKQFEKGVSRQASLLQTLALAPGLKYLNIREYEVEAAAFSVEQLRKKELSPESIKKITDLLPGLYRVSFYKHTMLYYKCSDKESYLWSPMDDRGLIDIGTNVQTILFEVFNFISDKTEDSLDFFQLLSLEEQAFPAVVENF